MVTMTVQNFGARVKEVMDRRGLTAYGLASSADLSPTAVYKIIAGERQPSLESAVKLAQALNVTTSELLGEREPEVLTSTEETVVANRIAEILPQLTDIDTYSFLRNFAALELPTQLTIERIVEQLAAEGVIRRRPKNPLYRIMGEKLVDLNREFEVFTYRADRDDIDYNADETDPTLLQELALDGITTAQIRMIEAGWRYYAAQPDRAEKRASLVRDVEDIMHIANYAEANLNRSRRDEDAAELSAAIYQLRHLSEKPDDNTSTGTSREIETAAQDHGPHRREQDSTADLGIARSAKISRRRVAKNTADHQ